MLNNFMNATWKETTIDLNQIKIQDSIRWIFLISIDIHTRSQISLLPSNNNNNRNIVNDHHLPTLMHFFHEFQMNWCECECVKCIKVKQQLTLFVLLECHI